MKQIKHLFVALALVASVSSAWADANGTCGTNLTWTYVESTHTLTISGTGAMTGYHFTSTLAHWDSYTSFITTVVIEDGVTKIGSYAFYKCTGLTSVIIPSSVTSIETGAFNKCSTLTSITIPNSVTSIGNQVFRDCIGLTTIALSETLTTLGMAAFQGCTNLQSITIPNGVTSINPSTFTGCSSFTSIAIPNSVTSICEQAFNGCTGLTSVTIPSSVSSILDYIFLHCTSLTDITVNWSDLSSVTINSNIFHGLDLSGIRVHVPAGTYATYAATEPWNSVKILDPNYSGQCGDNLFWEYNPSTKTLTISGTGAMTDYNNYSSLAPWNTYKNEMTTVVIESGATTVGQYAFYQCTALTSIDIPAGVTAIEYNAFDSCTGLISINLPNTLTSIYNSAFKNCTALTSITIPANVNYIKSSAFDNCSALTSISVDANNTFYDSRDNCNAIIQTAYKRLLVGCRNTVIPNGVTTIGDEAFYGRTNLSSIEIPNTVKTIGTSTFAYCIDLEFVTIPSSVTKIYGSAFADCGLKDVYVNWTDLSGVTLYPNIFKDVTLANVNLHLPFEAWGSYNGEPWSGFKQVPMITAKADPDHAGVYYNTFYHGSVAYELQTGVEAYTAKLSGSDLILTKVAQAGQTLPANTAVILKSSVASYEMTPSDATPVTVGENDLQGVDAATAAPSNCYVLSGPNSTNGLTEVGFYTFSGTLGAHKAYLVVPGSSPAPKHLRFVFDATVDIETVTGNPSPVTEKILRDGVLYIQRGEQLYNAQGVRVE